MKKSPLFYFLFILVFISCSSNSDDDPIDPPTTTEITYNNTIKSIVNSNCLNCHTNPPTNGAPMPLTSYQNVRDAVTSRNLISRIEDGSMPPGPTQLSSAQIKAFKDWRDEGFKQ